MKHVFILLLLSGLCSSLASSRPDYINPAGRTLASRFRPPAGYVRQMPTGQPLPEYLRQLPLKPHHSPVLLYNGQRKNRQDVHAAVLQLEIGQRDLQQCADAVMRLRAEYLYQHGRYSDIHFNFTSGDRADFTRYARGYRPRIQGNRVTWQQQAAPSQTYATLRRYLDLVFTYAGTASLQKELVPVPNLKAIAPGDVFIQGGHPGHAVMVVDVAVHPSTGDKVFLLAQSYMPAQEIHILKNLADPAHSPWYRSDIQGPIETPEWIFRPTHLKRFPKW